MRWDHLLRAMRELANAALEMIAAYGARSRAVTPGGDQGYNAQDFVMELREVNLRPHAPQHTQGRRSASDRCTTRHAGCAMSQRIRKRVEEAFGWIKAVAGRREAKRRGLDKVDWTSTFAAAAHNLVRLPELPAVSL